MSYMKKALEKARKERKTLFDNVEGRTEKRDEEALKDLLAKREAVRPSSKQGDVTNPVYTDTKVIQINRDKLIENRIFAINENDAVADQYKLLRTMILNKTRPNGFNTIEVTSFKDNEGKSLTAVNLAVTLAKESRQTVLLVDADLRQPSIGTIFGINSNPGLKDYFLNDVPLKDILVHPELETLTVIPGGGRMNNSTEIIGSHRMEDLVVELKTRYKDRFIIFDTPALNQCPDALVLSSYLDGIVLVARAAYTTNDDIKSGLELVKDRNVLGIVLNDSEIAKGWAY